jgi:hypothetical protein
VTTIVLPIIPPAPTCNTFEINATSGPYTSQYLAFSPEAGLTLFPDQGAAYPFTIDPETQVRYIYRLWVPYAIVGTSSSISGVLALAVDYNQQTNNMLTCILDGDGDISCSVPVD